jgi:hypothetical protein
LSVKTRRYVAPSGLEGHGVGRRTLGHFACHERATAVGLITLIFTTADGGILITGLVAVVAYLAFWAIVIKPASNSATAAI